MIKRLKNLLFLYAFFLILHTSYSESLNDPINLSDNSLSNIFILNEGWNLIPSDDIQYKNGVNNEKAYTYRSSAPWQYEIPEISNYDGIVWSSIDFIFNDDVKKKDIGLSLYTQYSSIQIYLNGTKIYESNNWKSDGKRMIGESPFYIILPYDKLEQNKPNTIAIRSGSFSGWGGAAYIKIGYYQNIKRELNKANIQNIGIGFASLFIFIYFLLQYFLRKEDRYYLFFSLSSLSISFFLLGFYGHLLTLFNFSWAYWVITFIGGINMYLMPILFVHSFFNFRKSIVIKIFISFYSFCSLFVLIEYFLTGQISFFIKYFYNLFNLTYILVVPFLIFLCIKAVIKKLKFSRIMLIGTVFLAVSFLLSMLSFASIIRIEPPIGEGFFAMIVVFSFVLAKRFAQTHQNLETAHGDLISAANEIRELNDSLEVKVASRTRELSEKNELITESLEYAAQIQQSVLPAREEMVTLFEDYFTLWKPKGIVGGDIYWRHQHEDGFLFAVIDCTGHGVPGALLTMSVTSAMDYIVEQMNIFDPADVLFHLNNIMKGKLNQGSTDPFADDGLEIALVSCTNGMNRLHFAGSKLRLFALEKGEINEYKGSRYSIGFKRSRKDQKFEQHTIHFTEETRFFLTTDGFIEQSGGPRGFGLGWERFRKLLLESRGSMSETGIFLEKSFDDYRNEREQRDDVLVIGFTLDVD